MAIPSVHPNLCFWKNFHKLYDPPDQFVFGQTYILYVTQRSDFFIYVFISSLKLYMGMMPTSVSFWLLLTQVYYHLLQPYASTSVVLLLVKSRGLSCSEPCSAWFCNLHARGTAFFVLNVHLCNMQVCFSSLHLNYNFAEWDESQESTATSIQERHISVNSLNSTVLVIFYRGSQM